MFPKIYYTQTYCHEKFHICSDIRAHYTFDISANDLQHDIFEIFYFWIVCSQVLLGGPLANVGCTGIQGISAQLPGGSIGQSWVDCIQGISA